MNDIPAIDIRELLYCIEQGETDALDCSVKNVATHIQQAITESETPAPLNVFLSQCFMTQTRQHSSGQLI